MRKTIGLVVLALFLAGCGDEEEAAMEAVAGIYQTTKHTINEEGCQAEGPEVTDMPYFQFVVQDLFGTKFLSFGTCESADESTCVDAGIFGAWRKSGSGFEHTVFAASGGGQYGTCVLSYVFGTMVSIGGSVTMEIRTYREEDASLSEDACDTDEAEARGTGMPCVRYEVIEGTRIN